MVEWHHRNPLYYDDDYIQNAYVKRQSHVESGMRLERSETTRKQRTALYVDRTWEGKQRLLKGCLAYSGWECKEFRDDNNSTRNRS